MSHVSPLRRARPTSLSTDKVWFVNELKLKLMYKESLRRLGDAELLRNAAGLREEGHDSAYLLQLLGLELQLKFIYEIEVEAQGYGHDYKKLFAALPVDTKRKILQLAEQRAGVTALSIKHELVLKEWGDNFVGLRYPYEKYSHLSEAEYVALGPQWESGGCRLEDATFRFYPNELHGFLHAIGIVAKEHAVRAFGIDWA